MEAKLEIERLKGQIIKCKRDLSFNLTDKQREDIKSYMYKCYEKKLKIEEKYFLVSIPSWIFRRYKNKNEE